MAYIAIGDTLLTVWSALQTPRVLTIAALLTALVIATLRVRKSSSIEAQVAEAKPSDDSDKKRREYGEWTPVKFAYPEIQPWSTELKDTKPIPYRPFRWGKYNDWIELDNQYESYHRIRAHRIQTWGERAIRVLGDNANPGVVRGGGEAAIELVHELTEYLCRRYPTTFKIVRHSTKSAKDYHWGWESAPPIKSITIVPLGVSYDLPLGVDDGERAPERAMEISALLVQDDLALMIEGADGRYYFQAGAICVPGFWRMQDKIGLPLDEIHITGNVPQYREKLDVSLERFFRRLPVDKPVIRNNYFVQVVRPKDMEEEEIDPEELAWSTTTNGSEDTYSHGHAFAPPAGRPTPTADTLRFRTERQTLRRLPGSGAIVFTIRTYVVPLVELGEERGVPGRMASAVRGWTEDVSEYKGRERGGWTSVLLEYMDARHREQVERGEVEEGERVAEYPY